MVILLVEVELRAGTADAGADAGVDAAEGVDMAEVLAGVCMSAGLARNNSMPGGGGELKWCDGITTPLVMPSKFLSSSGMVVQSISLRSRLRFSGFHPR